MSLRPSLRFAIPAAAVALGSGGLAVGLATRGGALSWAVAGWAPVAAAAIAGGAWLAEAHGRMSGRFFLAFGAGMAARSMAVVGSLALALAGPADAWKPCLTGIALGYFPLQIFEIAWFWRTGARGNSRAPLTRDAKGLA